MRDEDVVRAGNDVRESFSAFSDQVEDLKKALSNLAEKFRPLVAKEKAHDKHHHLASHLPHWNALAESAENHEIIIAAILTPSVKIVLAVMTILVAVHPAIHHIMAVIVPHADDIEKWAEKAVHAASECKLFGPV